MKEKWSQSVLEQLNFHCQLPKRAKIKYLVMSHYFTSILQSSRNLHSLCGTFSSSLPLRQNKICGIEKPNTKMLQDHTYRTPFKKNNPLISHSSHLQPYYSRHFASLCGICFGTPSGNTPYNLSRHQRFCFHHSEHILALCPKSLLLSPLESHNSSPIQSLNGQQLPVAPLAPPTSVLT